MSIELPKSLVEIGDEAFSGCTAFDGELIAPDGLQTVGKAAFKGCWGLDKARFTEPYEGAVSPEEV